MHRAAQALLGENDFTSFRAVQCQSRTPWRCVKHVKVTRYGEYIVVDIKANAFVHHMVRNIVGSLMEIGCGNQDENWMAELLALKDRNRRRRRREPRGCIWLPWITLTTLVYRDRRWGRCFARRLNAGTPESVAPLCFCRVTETPGINERIYGHHQVYY